MVNDHKDIYLRHAPDLYLCEVGVGNHADISCGKSDPIILNGTFIEQMTKNSAEMLIGYAAIDRENKILIYFNTESLEISKYLQSGAYKTELFRHSISQDVGDVLRNSPETVKYSDGTLLHNNFTIPVTECNIPTNNLDVCLQCNALPDPDCNFYNGKCSIKSPNGIDRYSECNKNRIKKSGSNNNIYIIATPTGDKPQSTSHQWLDSSGTPISTQNFKSLDQFMAVLNIPYAYDKVESLE